MGRSILAVIAGLIVGGLIVAGVEYIAQIVYPPPEGLDMTDMEAVREFAAGAPASARLIVLLAWFLGPFGGAWVAAHLARRSPMTHALVVGVFFLVADTINLVTIPSPIWMWIGGFVAPVLGAYLAARLVDGRTVLDQESSVTE
ncbi:MAG: hypothetical protein R3282_05140 [Rhodothermales bacterium]|nr:hypothetical protein [Rhodothermales bacterium]